ncbi:MAG TPA: hypothetical protein DIT13_17585 [Verrucomicrobiales bacterium]|nr:hypothetical protein [Verrucomicrobiales bacterium]HRK15277.1 hypothetical protein [Prosthecobacter sp.]
MQTVIIGREPVAMLLEGSFNALLGDAARSPCFVHLRVEFIDKLTQLQLQELLPGLLQAMIGKLVQLLMDQSSERLGISESGRHGVISIH